jgi:hypothetical protein
LAADWLRMDLMWGRDFVEMCACGAEGCMTGERKKERKKWRTSLSPKAMGPRAAAGGKCAV